MRAALKLLPLLLLASFPAAAQEAPRVLFCSGPCFAVDGKGVRTPATKGTELAPGQRLETGPNGYAQVRMGRDAAVGISEQARVRFQQNAVTLDEGRVRLVGGAALGRPGAAPVELRTGDGTLVLRSPDVEVKKTSLPGSIPGPTLVKLNSGDAGLRSGQGQIPLPRQDLQGISDGKLLSRGAVPANGLDQVSRPRVASAPARVAPVAAALTPVRIPAPLTRDSIVLSPTISPTLSPTILSTTTTLATTTLTPVVSTGDTLLRQPIVDSTTGTTTTLTQIIVSEPILTTTTTSTTSLKTLSIQPTTTTTTSTTLSPIRTDTQYLLRR
jgi:hypothetical protein